MVCTSPFCLVRLTTRLRCVLFLAVILVSLPVATAAAQSASGTERAKAAPTAPDTLVLINGNRISGTFIRSLGGVVTFRSPILGVLQVPWGAIKELQSKGNLVVIGKMMLRHRDKKTLKLPSGPITMSDQLITIHPENGASITPIPVKNAEYIIDEKALQKEINAHPSFLAGWNGTVTGAASVVQSSQDQYSLTGLASFIRTIPTVSWLRPRNRTLVNFNGTFGKIIQPSFSYNGIIVPKATSKVDLYHAVAERDESVSTRFYLLGKATFDHSSTQDLNLQQMYGGGIGWIAIRRSKQGLYVDTLLQYVSQNFHDTASSDNQKFLASAVDATWGTQLPAGGLFKQTVYCVPALTNTHNYSMGEYNSLTLRFWNSLGFTIGSTDYYINDPPSATPPTKRNSLQFDIGLTYIIHSK